jgi:hypothetical protein
MHAKKTCAGSATAVRAIQIQPMGLPRSVMAFSMHAKPSAAADA